MATKAQVKKLTSLRAKIEKLILEYNNLSYECDFHDELSLEAHEVGEEEEEEAWNNSGCAWATSSSCSW